MALPAIVGAAAVAARVASSAGRVASVVTRVWRFSGGIRGFAIRTLLNFASAEKDLRTFSENTEKAIGRAIPQHAAKVASLARANARLHSGAYVSSIRSKVSRDKQSAVILTDPTVAPHAHLVHFGTINMSGDFALYKASDRLENELTDIAERELDRAIDEFNEG